MTHVVGRSLATCPPSDDFLTDEMCDVSRGGATVSASESWQGPFGVLVEHAADLIAVIDSADRILYGSPASVRLFGPEPPFRPPLPFVRFVHPEDVVMVRRALRRLARAEGRPVTFEARMGGANEQWRYVEIVATNHLHNPAVRGIVVNARDITEQVAATEQIAWQAGHDMLTGLVNRSLLFERIGEALERAVDDSGFPAVLLLDLDGFKPLNDRFGHRAGDRLLVELAGRLTRACRRADTVARFGPDEFVVLAERVRDEQVARAIANRTLRSLRDPFVLGEEKVGEEKVSASGSVGVALGTDLDADGLLRRADTALREAKGRGPGSVVIFAEGHEDGN